MAASPLQPHAVTAAELAARNAATRRGTPFLVYLDGDGRQVIVDLEETSGTLVVGRQPGSDLCIDWDPSVSRVHARLERLGTHWTVVDDGLSRHGTFLHGERIDGRRRLGDGDLIGVGQSVIAYCDPVTGLPVSTAPVMAAVTPPPVLTPAQRRVLVELCRPLLDGSRRAPPATAGSPRRWWSPSTASSTGSASSTTASGSSGCRRTRSAPRWPRPRSAPGSSRAATSEGARDCAPCGIEPRGRRRHRCRMLKTPHIGSAHVLAAVALFVALGGTAMANDKVRAFVTGADVRNGSLTGKDVRNRSLTAADLAPGVLRAGSQGPAGPQGPRARER